MNSSTGWSIQRPPNSNNLSFLDRATGLTRVTLEQGTGNVGIGTDNPTAHLQVGSSPQNFSDVTTLGVGQGSGDTVALSLRRLSNDPIMQFCSDGTGGCSYVAFDRLTGEINIGADVSGNNPALSVEKTGGQVGIGKTSAGVPLDVEEQGVTNGLEKLIRLNNTAATHPCWFFAQQQSTGNLGGALHIVDEKSGAGSRMVIRGNGNVGIGTGTTSPPHAKLEVAGQVKIAGGNPGAGKVLTSDANGLASWSAAASGGSGTRVIHLGDSRPGCPGLLPSNTAIFTQAVSVTGDTPVYVTVGIIRKTNGRADPYMYLDGTLIDLALTNTSSSQWEDANLVWSGILSGGSHTLTVDSPSADVWGCGVTRGSMDIVIFE